MQDADKECSTCAGHKKVSGRPAKASMYRYVFRYDNTAIRFPMDSRRDAAADAADLRSQRAGDGDLADPAQKVAAFDFTMDIKVVELDRLFRQLGLRLFHVAAPFGAEDITEPAPRETHAGQ